MQPTSQLETPDDLGFDDEGMGVGELVSILTKKWRLLLGGSLVAGAVALGFSYLIAPTYTARTLFLPPQPPQGAAASALASLSALSNLAGGAGGVKTAADQYVSLMQSANVQDRLIDRFKLMAEYEAKYRFQARKTLSDNVRITLGKKDGLITLEADAHSPQLAADLANAHVTELRRLTGELTLTEAQQRRAFFEAELKRTREQLTQAQTQLQRSGFDPGALKTEPKAAAETYARVRAEATTAEVRLQTLRRTLADGAPEIQQQQALLAALRDQLARLEAATKPRSDDADYVGRYREYKYQEALFELFSRQYEAARLDESREGALIQVIDVASVPEYKSKPRRASIAVGATLIAALVLAVLTIGLHLKRQRRPKLD